MTGLVLALAALACAAIPAVAFLRNLRLYLPPPQPDRTGAPPRISVLIPARNEEGSIRAAVESALAGEDVEVEVIVLDDHSTDATADVVREIAARDGRVRVEPAPPLPEGWCGKQHACFVLAGLASHSLLAFLDADVRLEPAGLARATAFLQQADADLVSGVPRQETGTLGEKLLIPLIHFVLLGFLPMGRMRATRQPAYGAGCGQFFLARRESYEKAGGHEAVRQSLHDGIKLPRAFRAAGLATDLFDATDVATCRMYKSFPEVWRGLAKNAIEGMAAPRLIVPASLLLAFGQVVPLALLAAGLCGPLTPAATMVAGVGTAASYAPRLLAGPRFRQSWIGAMLHPLGVGVFLLIQWYAFLRWAIGRPAGWKGRSYGGLGTF